jgi:hypothetical protein
MEDRGGPLKQAASQGILKALSLAALRLYESHMV